VTLSAWAVDESARIDVNAAPEPLLRGLIERVGGADPEAAAKIADAIQDWRDPDDLRRPNGAEAADYQSAGLPQKPSNAPFETVSEVSRVMGVTPAIFARISDNLTVHSRQPGINPALASRDVLLALPGATPELVDAYLQQRADARAARLPVPPFPAAANYVAGAVPVWHIRATATVSDGVTFVREAVVRPSGDTRRPLLTLNWREGSVVAAPVPAAGTPAADGKPAAEVRN
jgi:general secretion pathway protein K